MKTKHWRTKALTKMTLRLESKMAKQRYRMMGVNFGLVEMSD